MSKVVLTDTSSGYRVSVINENFQEIQDELNDKVLYRDNPAGEPNQMESILDMNGNRIINLPSPQNANDAARLGDIPFNPIDIGTTSALLTTFTPTVDISAINVQAAVEEVSTELRTLDTVHRADLADYANTTKGAALVGFDSTLSYSNNSIGKALKGFVNVRAYPFLAVGDGVVDDAPAIQAALDYANTMGGYGVFVPPGIYAIKSIRNPTISVSGLGTISASLRIYANTTLYGPRAAILKNFNDTHFLVGDNANSSVIKGLTIDCQAQALDDLSSAAITALSAIDYPNKAYSGYGTETPLNIYTRMYQYAGWPYGSTPDGSVRHCVWFTNTLAARVITVKFIRTQTSAIRCSNNTRAVVAHANELYQPRFVGINFSTNTRGCVATSNTIISCLQIGIAMFDLDGSGSDAHIIENNTLLNSQTEPLGENGIELSGTIGFTYPLGGTINGNTIIGYGSQGIRGLQCSHLTVNGNHVRSIRLNATQQARYPNATDGVGIGLRSDCTYSSATDNTIANVNTYGTYVDEKTSKADFSNIITGAGTAKRFWVENGSSESDATAGVVSGTTLTYPDWTDTIRLTGGTTYSINSILPAGSEGEIRHIIKRTASGVVTLTNSALTLRSSAASQALTVMNDKMSIKWMNGAWIEWDRSIV